MINLYFKDLFSVLTIGLVLGMIIFIILTIKNRHSITKWGRRTALFIVVGIAISALSAIRDSYAAPNALFSMSSIQSTVCSIAGGAIILAGLITIFIKNQQARKTLLHVIFVLFAAQVLVIEISRPIIML